MSHYPHGNGVAFLAGLNYILFEYREEASRLL